MTDTDLDAVAFADRLRDELADTLGVEADRLCGAARLREDLGLDSMQLVSCLAWLEGFGITVSDPVGTLLTVDSVLDLVNSRRALGPHGRLAVGRPSKTATSPTTTTTMDQATQDGLEPILTKGMYTLRPISQADHQFLYNLATRPDTGFRWRYRGTVPPIERFVSELWQSTVLAQFVAADASSGAPQGLVVCYQADLVGGHAYVGAVFSQEARRTGVPATAVVLFIDYLFKIHPVRKLYFEVPGWNMTQIASGIGSYFEEEACLRLHDYYDGKYWNKYLLAVHRTNWTAVGHSEPILRLFPEGAAP